QSTAAGTSVIALHRHQHAIDRQDAENGPWPVSEHQHAANDVGNRTGQPPVDHSQHESCERQRGLHRQTALVRGLTWREQGAVIKTMLRRLFHNVHVNGRAREKGSDHESKIARQHSKETIPRYRKTHAVRSSLSPESLMQILIL